MSKYLKPSMIADTKDLVLEEIPAGEKIRMFRLIHPKGHALQGHYWVYIMFTPIGCVIGGDLFGRGIISDKVSLDFFEKDIKDCEEYLAGKFFKRAWHVDTAKEWCREHAREIREGKHDPSGKSAAVVEDYRQRKFRGWTMLADDIEGCVVETVEQFIERIEALGWTLDGDGPPGDDYPRVDAGFLVAIQKRFSEERQKLVAAAEAMKNMEAR